MSAINNLYAGVPVTALDARIDRYTRLSGRPPDMRAGDEILWDLAIRRSPDPDANVTAFAELPDAA